MIMMLRETPDYDRWISEYDIPSPDDNLIANLNEFQIAASLNFMCFIKNR